MGCGVRIGLECVLGPGEGLLPIALEEPCTTRPRPDRPRAGRHEPVDPYQTKASAKEPKMAEQLIEVATRYDRLALRYEATVLVAAITEWLRAGRSQQALAPGLSFPPVLDWSAARDPRRPAAGARR